MFEGSIGLILNLIVIFVIAVYEPLRCTRLTSAFVVNLAAIDSTVSVLIIFTNIYEFEWTHSMIPGDTSDEILCRVWYTEAPLWGMMMSSTYGILALTFERYVGIVHPVWHRTSFTHTQVSCKFILRASVAHNIFVLFPVGARVWKNVVGIRSKSSIGLSSLQPNSKLLSERNNETISRQRRTVYWLLFSVCWSLGIVRYEREL